jgi:hypothetical protein
MKHLAIFFGLFLIFAGAMRVSAQTVTYDSASLASPFVFAFSIQDDSAMLGNPDGTCAQFADGASCALRFMVATTAITMQKGDSIHIYWKIPSLAPGDSNVAQVQLQNLDENLKPHGDTAFLVLESSPLNVEGMSTIIVPDTGFNAIGIDVSSLQFGGNSFWLDAMVLVQKGTAGVVTASSFQQPMLANYPNPFYHSSGTHVEVHVPVAGIGVLSVTDALGREVKRVPMGELSAGDIEATLSLDRAGVFFVRLFIDGEPYGVPLEVSGE